MTLLYSPILLFIYFIADKEYLDNAVKELLGTDEDSAIELHEHSTFMDDAEIPTAIIISSHDNAIDEGIVISKDLEYVLNVSSPKST